MSTAPARVGAMIAVGALLACPLSLLACGGSRAILKVAAAASLQRPLARYASQFRAAAVSYSFAGSDALAAQIAQGQRPDVFASADARLAHELFAKGLVLAPVAFAGNRLVLAVPRGSAIHSLADAERPRVTIALGTATVPVGTYARALIDRLRARARRELLANVRDREPDVTGIVGKLSEGAVGAGFVYATDVAATGGALRAISLPAALQPPIRYAAAVVRGTRHGPQARAFVDGLVAGDGREDLRAAGFEPERQP